MDTQITVSMRRLFEQRKQMFKLMDKKKKTYFTLILPGPMPLVANLNFSIACIKIIEPRHVISNNVAF